MQFGKLNHCHHVVLHVSNVIIRRAQENLVSRKRLGKQTISAVAGNTGVSLLTSLASYCPSLAPNLEEGSSQLVASIRPNWIAFNWSAYTRKTSAKKSSESTERGVPEIIDIPGS